MKVIYNDLNKMGIGLMRFDPQDSNNINNFIHQAISIGSNYFEGCSFYNQNHCEELLSQALKPFNRSSYYLADKLDYYTWKTSNLSVKDFVFKQLKIFNTNYFDFYLIQAVDRKYFINRNDDLILIIQQLSELVNEGIIKYLGFSFHDTIFYLKQIINLYNWDFVQISLNFHTWYNGIGKELYTFLKEHNIPIFVMNGQSGGLLSQYSNLCNRFLNTLSQVRLVLNGTTNIQEFQDNFNIINSNKKVLQNEISFMKQVSNNLLSKIPCVGCGYCNDKCSQEINIKQTFLLYNNDRNKLKELLKEKNSALNCIGCQQCEQYCPQHLPISQLMSCKIFNERL